MHNALSRTQDERRESEQTLKGKIAELTAAAQQRDAASSSDKASLQAAQQEAGSLRRQLDEATALLDTERRAAARQRTEHTTALSDLQVRTATASIRAHHRVRPTCRVTYCMAAAATAVWC